MSDAYEKALRRMVADHLDADYGDETWHGAEVAAEALGWPAPNVLAHLQAAGHFDPATTPVGRVFTKRELAEAERAKQRAFDAWMKNAVRSIGRASVGAATPQDFGK